MSPFSSNEMSAEKEIRLPTNGQMHQMHLRIWLELARGKAENLRSTLATNNDVNARPTVVHTSQDFKALKLCSILCVSKFAKLFLLRSVARSLCTFQNKCNEMNMQLQLKKWILKFMIVVKCLECEKQLDYMVSARCAYFFINLRAVAFTSFAITF